MLCMVCVCVVWYVVCVSVLGGECRRPTLLVHDVPLLPSLCLLTLTLLSNDIILIKLRQKTKPRREQREKERKRRLRKEKEKKILRPVPALFLHLFQVAPHSGPEDWGVTALCAAFHLVTRERGSGSGLPVSLPTARGCPLRATGLGNSIRPMAGALAHGSLWLIGIPADRVTVKRSLLCIYFLLFL